MDPVRDGALLVAIVSLPLAAQQAPLGGWPQHSRARPAPPVVTPGPYVQALPPKDAIVLFDGMSLDRFVMSDSSAAKWRVVDGAFEVMPGTGTLVSRDVFGDVQLHIEWMAPDPPRGRDQDRGNSGVFFGGGRYEVQVLDSYRNATYPDGQAASLYGQFPPLVNASRAPGELQSYDIPYRRPRFPKAGAVLSPPRPPVLPHSSPGHAHSPPNGPPPHRSRPGVALWCPGLGERSTERWTTRWVAAGAVAKKWLQARHGTGVVGWMSARGDRESAFEGLEHIPNNAFFAANASQIPELEAYMDVLRKKGDSVGARIEVRATGVPVGLGQPLFDKLDADIAYAMMGINAVKGVEIGDGFAVVAQNGSVHGDELSPEGFRSNHAGGVLGGISTGQDLVVRIAIKPTSSIRWPKASIDRQLQPTTVETFGRHDPCVGIRATPIAEAMLALVLMDHVLLHRAQCGDVQLPVAPIQGASAA